MNCERMEYDGSGIAKDRMDRRVMEGNGEGLKRGCGEEG